MDAPAQSQTLSHRQMPECSPETIQAGLNMIWRDRMVWQSLSDTHILILSMKENELCAGSVPHQPALICIVTYGELLHSTKRSQRTQFAVDHRNDQIILIGRPAGRLSHHSQN
jgi:hypothetical protein